MTRPRLALAALLVAAPVHAADYSWIGGTQVNGVYSWTTSANYTPLPPGGNGPNVADRVFFDNNSTGSLDTVLNNNFNLTTVVVGNNVVTATDPILVGPGTLNAGTNNTLTLTTNGLTTGGLDLSTANRGLTFNTRVIANDAQSWRVNAARTLTLNREITVNAALSVNGLSGGGVGSLGTVVLANTGNVFNTGSSLTIRNGVLQVAAPAALGSGGTALGTVGFGPQASGGSGTEAATLTLTGAGTYAQALPLTSTADALRSRVNAAAAGAVTLSGAVTANGSGANGVVELNTLTGTVLTVSQAVTAAGGFTGTLQLGGGGDNTGGSGTLSAAPNLSGTGKLVKVDTGATWTLATGGVGATAWGSTAVRAGILRLAAANALPSGASLSLGLGGLTGTVELNAATPDQSVTGLSTGTDPSLANPAGNQIGIGNVAATTATLTYLGGTTSYAGVIASSVAGTATNKVVNLAVTGGSLTLQGANTYTGTTVVGGGGGAATLALGNVSGSGGGTAFANFGSFANSPVIDVRANGTLSVGGLTGGANYDPGLTNQFAVAANQTLRGVGTVTGGVTVLPAGSIRGGTAAAPTGTLSLANGLTLRGGTPAASTGGQWVIDLNNTTTAASSLTITSPNALNFDVNTNSSAVALRLVGSGGLVYNTPYTFNIATASAYNLNGGGVAGYTYGTQFSLTLDNTGLPNFNGTPTLSVVGGNTLQLSFTPVPEPATVGLLAVAALGGVRAVRRRILAG